MKTWIIVGAVSVASGLAVAGTANAQSASENIKLSQAECQVLWKQADSSAAGSLSMAQAQPFVSNFKSVDANGDGKLSSSEFTKGCDAGHVRSSASTGAGAGSSGSSSSGSTDAPAKKY